MFRLIANRCFQITFANGWTVVVTFADADYCKSQSVDILPPLDWQSTQAVVGVWKEGEETVGFGRRTAEEVAKIISDTAAITIN